MVASMEKVKPAAVAPASGFGDVSNNLGTADTLDISTNVHARQALVVRNRFGLTWPVARATAELHFGGAA